MSDSPNGAVMTVNGPVDPDELGVTLTHEHLFLDLRPAYAVPPKTEADREFAEGPYTIEKLGRMKRDFGCVHDALLLDDPELALAEVGEFARRGGKTIVDVTPNGIHVQKEGFRPQALLDLSRDSGLNIVLGSGYYVHHTHPPDMGSRSVDSLTEELLQELYEGIGGTGVRPGVIGEIGMFQPIHPDEWKALEAACRAQKETGLPLTIHPHFGTRSRVAPRIARFVLDQGVDPGRVNFCHMDGFMNLEYQRLVADLGCFISFDTFGLEAYYDSGEFNHNTHDSHREELLLRLLDLGYADRLMISHDCASKAQMTRYGGYGYGHILRNIVPSLRFEGVDQATFDQLLIENPKRWLTIDSTAPGYAAVVGAGVGAAAA